MANKKQQTRHRYNRVSIDDLYYSNQNRNDSALNKKARENRRMSKRDNPFFKNDKYVGANITTMYNQAGKIYSNDLIDGKYRVCLDNGKTFYSHYTSLTLILYF